ncbi:hypothetical protein PVAND_009302 [Polypedilum vanderplanki]|uniref:KANSL3 helical domain-containing protein n=1 Tax=Polypedilum vanderplanki TaxID=319348 RepID=A0A9J6CCH8_POLVA|nr:hypothetical protein PVAND_009302 [Polypedilum vanderplanki]
MEQFALRKSILVSKPNNNSYPACWFHIPDENEISDPNIPTYDIDASKNAMEKTTQMTSVLKNNNREEDDWESKILKYGWTPPYTKLFNRVVQILDNDHLARLSHMNSKRHEVVQIRTSIDRAADRMRRALAAINWDTAAIQWLHGILMEYLPPSYLASYLDIMQTLRNKRPSLVDRMIFWKPGNINQDLLSVVLKRPWSPMLSNKYRKLPGSTMAVVIPPLPRLIAQSTRVQRFYTLFATMSPILPIQLSVNHIMAHKQSLQSIAEQIVSITRSKIQELKAENPDRRLILIGMHSSSSLALQVALVEQVSGVVCLGFSYNTVHGPRGQPDDHVLNLNTPVLFMIGQNAARTSEEEVENFREKLSAPSTILTIGCGDDFLRVSKKKRQLEGVTQEMVDNMIVDEIAEFATKCIQRPLPQRPKQFTTIGNVSIHRQIDSSTANQIRKRKSSQYMDGEVIQKVPKMKTTKMMRPTSTTSYINANSNDAIEMAVQSILPDAELKAKGARISTGVAQRMKIVPSQNMKPQQHSHKLYLEGSRQLQKNILQMRPSSSSRPSTPSSSQIIYSTNARLSASLGKLPVQTTTSFSPPKFTIVRQITANEAGEVNNSNIFEMPIVYADSEGNIEDEAAVSDGSVIEIPSDSSSSSNPTKRVLLKAQNLGTYGNTPTTITITKNKNILMQKPQLSQPSTSKMLVLNGSVIGRSVSASNIIIPKTITTTAVAPHPTVRIQKIIPSDGSQIKSQISSGKKVEILNNQIIKPASQPSKTMTFVNLADAKPIQGARLSLPITTTAVKPGQQIVIKTANLKQFTLPAKHFSNLTVKKINPSTNITPTTSVIATTSTATTPSAQKPKIIFKPANS